MQIPWRSLRKPTRRQAGSWPPTATQCILLALGISLLFRYFIGEAVVLRAALELSAPGLLAGRYWQPLTHLFLGSVPRLDFAALLGLYVAGTHLEFIIGRRHLWQLFLLAGILGGLAQLGRDDLGPASAGLAGPMAAVMGLLFALTVVLPDLELAPLLGFPLPFWLKIKHCALAAILMCAGLPLLLPDSAFAQQQAMRCLVGCLAGYFYMRQLGFGRRPRPRADELSPAEPMLQIAVFSPVDDSPRQADGCLVAPSSPRFTERERRMTPRQYISEQIDPILDKITLHGMACLTAEERRILDKGREKITHPSEF